MIRKMLAIGSRSSLALWVDALTPPTVWSGYLLASYLLTLYTKDSLGVFWLRVEMGLLAAVVEVIIVLAGMHALRHVEPPYDARDRGWNEDGNLGFTKVFALLSAIVFTLATLFVLAPVFALSHYG